MDMFTKKGFTLPEVLIVIGILAILAVIVILAVDPVARFENAHNSRRLSDLQAITSALHQYVIDHRGVFPEGLDSIERQIGTGRTGCAVTTSQCTVTDDTGCVDLSKTIEPYLHGVPADPKTGDELHSRYTVHIGRDNAVIVKSCDLTE